MSAGRRSNGPGVHGESQRPTNIAGCRGGTFGPPAPHSGDYSPVTNGLKGCAHSLCDFFVETCHGLETGLLHIGLGEMDCDLHDRCRMNDSISLAQANRSARIDAGIQSFLGVDPSDAVYQQSRSYMTTGLQVASLAAGGYGAVKGLAYLHRMPMLSPTKTLQNLNRFHQNAYNLSKTAQNNIRVLRGWAKSKGWERLPNPTGAPERWGIYNANGKFEWRLRIKSEASTRIGLESGSHVPRFDARVLTDLDGKSYINPFSGEVGNSRIGTHLPLENVY